MNIGLSLTEILVYLLLDRKAMWRTRNVNPILLREAAKKVLFLVVGPLRGGGAPRKGLFLRLPNIWSYFCYEIFIPSPLYKKQFNVRPVFQGERVLDSFNMVIPRNKNNILHLIMNSKYVPITNNNWNIFFKVIIKLKFAILNQRARNIYYGTDIFTM